MSSNILFFLFQWPISAQIQYRYFFLKKHRCVVLRYPDRQAAWPELLFFHIFVYFAEIRQKKRFFEFPEKRPPLICP